MSDNGTLKYVHQDHLSGMSLMTSDNGTLLGTIKYTPYGDCLESQGTLATDKLFTGQRLDDTGLYYYGARYYDPTIGRFISADIVIPNPYDPQCLNRYTYCLNNPLKYTDPSGHLVYDENGNPIDTSDPYWIENLVFSGVMLVEEILEDVLTPTAAAWCDFVWSSGEYTAALAHALERDLNTIVNLKYGDLGYAQDSTFRKGSNENEYTIILNNNMYRDISKVDIFYRSGAILNQVYNIEFPLSESDLQKIYAIPKMIAGGAAFVTGEVMVIAGICTAPTGVGLTVSVTGTYFMITGYQWFSRGFNILNDNNEKTNMPDFPIKLPPIQYPWLIRDR